MSVLSVLSVLSILRVHYNVQCSKGDFAKRCTIPDSLPPTIRRRMGKHSFRDTPSCISRDMCIENVGCESLLLILLLILLKPLKDSARCNYRMLLATNAERWTVGSRAIQD